MFTRLTPRGTGKALVYVGTGISLGLVAMQLGCTNSNKAYETPSPNISAFLICRPNKGGWDSTAAKTVNIAKGGTVLIRANFATTGGTALITPGNLTPSTNGIITLNGITATTTYTLTVTSAKGDVSTSTVTAVVLNAPSNLTYSTADATCYQDVYAGVNTATVSGGGTYTYTVAPALPSGMTLDAATGAISGTPQAASASTAYTVTAKDSVDQTTTGTVAIKVLATPLSFTQSVRAVKEGDSATLTWDATPVSGLFSNVVITASPADTTLPATFGLSGSITVTPAVTTTYTLSAQAAAGGSPLTRLLGLTVGPGPLSFVSFNATPTVTALDGTSTLAWDYLNTPLTLTLDGVDVLGQVSRTVSPVRRQTYTLMGSNLLNTTDAVITTKVGAAGFDLLAGSTAGPGCQDGTGAAAKFGLNTAAISSTTGSSMNLSIDPSDNIYVADSLLHNLRMITSGGVVTTLAGRAGVPWVTVVNGDGSGNGTEARFKNPAHVLYVDANTLYVSDNGTQTVRQLSKQPNGTWTASVFAGTAGSWGDSSKQALDNPLCTVVYNGKLYIASSFDSSIRIYDPSAASGARFTVLAGGGGAGTRGFKDGTGSSALFYTLSSLALDPATGTLFVADRENHAIRQVTQAGVVTTIAGGAPTTAASGNVDGSGTAARFFRPTGIVRAPNGTLFVTDNNNHTVRKLVYNAATTAWDVTTIAGSGAPGYKEGAGSQAVFNGPEGITLDSAGNLYVADAANAVIRKLTPSADAVPVYASTPFAGARNPGTTDETIATARFTSPNGVAVDSANNVYVADEGNKAVRKIGADGSVSTIGAGFTFTDPYCLAVDGGKNVYVLDRLASTIQVVKIDATGAASVVPLSYTFTSNSPRGIAVTSDGASLFIAHGANIRKFNVTTGAPAANVVAGQGSVNGLVVDGTSLYWVDFTWHSVKKTSQDFSTPPVVTVVAGGNTTSTSGFVDSASAPRFSNPVALTYVKNPVTGGNFLYVADQANHAIRRIALATGEVSTVVGATESVKNQNNAYSTVPARMSTMRGTLGTGGTSGLYYPRGIGATTDGDLIVTSGDCLMQVTAPEGN